MTTIKEELLAATIRKQICYLEGLLNELESDPEKDVVVLTQIRNIEKQLLGLRRNLKAELIV